jgi:type VI secretion system protein ImpM
MLDLSFNRTETLNACSYTLFGKLPNRADFVRVNANHPVALEFDGWVQRALERMSGDVLSACAALSGSVDFQYLSRDQRYLMVGVLTPSSDQAGRHYPLVAGRIMPYDDVAAHLPVLPIAFEVFFDGLREQVINAVENSVEALSCRQFLETSLRTYESGNDDLQLAISVVERFMQQQPARRLSNLLVDSEQPATLQQALLNIAFYQAYLRRFDNRATNQLFLLPLSGSKGEQALMASTWQSILAALWGMSGPDAVWRCSHLVLRRPGQTPQLLVSVGRLPDSFASVMLGAEVERPLLLDLGLENEAWTSHRMYAEVSYALGRFLADPNYRIAELCSFLGGMSRQLVGSV